MTQREHLGHILLRRLPGFESLELAPNLNGMRLARGVDPGNMTQLKPVEHRRSCDRTEDIGLVLPLKETEGGWVHRGIIDFCFYVLGLFPNLSECVNACHE